MNKHLTTSVWLSVFLALSAAAEEKREHGTHVHGLGELNVAVEENQVLVELISPGANIVGFEHEPNNAEQEQAIEQAIEDLKQGGNLFVMSQQANCELDQAHVTSSILNDDHGHAEEGHEEEGHAEEGHAEEGHAEEGHAEEGHAEEGHAEEGHAEEGHAEESHEEEGHAEEHDHDDHDETGEDSVHSEFHAEYTFQCENIQDLSQIDVKLFEAFPLSESLNVQVLSASGQSAKTLNKEDTLLDL